MRGFGISPGSTRSSCPDNSVMGPLIPYTNHLMFALANTTVWLTYITSLEISSVIEPKRQQARGAVLNPKPNSTKYREHDMSTDEKRVPCRRYQIFHCCAHQSEKDVCSHAPETAHTEPRDIHISRDQSCCSNACCEVQIAKSNESQNLRAIEEEHDIPPGGSFTQRKRRWLVPGAFEGETSDQRRVHEIMERQMQAVDEYHCRCFVDAQKAVVSLMQWHDATCPRS